MADVFILSDKRRIDKNPPLFFIRKRALCHKAFDQGMNGVRAPRGSLC